MQNLSEKVNIEGIELIHRQNSIGRIRSPTIRQLSPHILKISVTHVVHPEDIEIWVFGNAFAHIGVEFERQFFALSCRLGEVDDFGTFGFGHYEGVVGGGGSGGW